MNENRIDELVDWLNSETLAEYYGITVHMLREGNCVLKMTANDTMTVSVGIVQGGVTSILADFVAVTAAMSKYPEGHMPCRGIDIKFLRPIKAGETVWAEAEVININRSSVLTSVKIEGDDNKIKAVATIEFAPPKKKK